MSYLDMTKDPKEFLIKCMERNGFWNIDCGNFGLCKRMGE